jgi:hypothetical protein
MAITISAKSFHIERVSNGLGASMSAKKKTEEIDGEIETRHPLDVSIRERMVRPAYKKHKAMWDKANDRLLDDPEGAITAARALLETTCKGILRELNVPFTNKSDLLKLYGDASRALGMAPGAQVDPSLRAVFSSTFQIVQAVAEIRNRYGDAHGRLNSGVQPSQADAELAVHLSGAVSCFLVSRFESHLNATRRLTRDGKAVLWFDKSTVWRLVDHATNSRRSTSWYGKRVGKCLLLVGDAGIYLMSNGVPAILRDGTLLKKDADQRSLRLTAEAEGCDSSSEFEAWWPLHNIIDKGSDFSIPIPVEEIRPVLRECHIALVIVADQEGYELMSDVEFEKRPAPSL